MRAILLDADALVAIAKVDDSNHARALSIVRKHRQAQFHISSFTIPEAATVLSYRVFHSAAVRFLEDIRKRGLVELELTPTVQRLADRIFFEQQRKGISWPDCLNVALLRHFQLDAIFSFDKFYKECGLEMLA